MATPSTSTSQESLSRDSGVLGSETLPIATPNLLLFGTVGPQSVLVAEQPCCGLPAVPATQIEAGQPADI